MFTKTVQHSVHCAESCRTDGDEESMVPALMMLMMDSRQRLSLLPWDLAGISVYKVLHTFVIL